MDRIPDEVLEFILGFLPPYGDLQKCLLVNKRWLQCAQNVMSKTSVNLHRALVDFDIVWESIVPVDLANTIAKRYSHSAIIHKNSMYVFGGCTCTSTTFNDLWRLNLSTRQFDRLLTMGTYPSPKACASIVCHMNNLILFGGWTHPSPYPLHQTWKLFNELHIYDIIQNRWTKHLGLEETPPPMAGHSVSVHKDTMVVFGGLQKHYSTYSSQFSSSNDIWCFDLINKCWFKQATMIEKPMPRYGQSQIYIDPENLLIIGGCGGPNLIYSDCWLLTLDSSEFWKWRKVKILNKDGGPGNMWCNQACKVGDKVVVLSQAKATCAPLSFSSKWNLPSQIRPNATNRPPGAPSPNNLVEHDGPQRLSNADKKEKPVDKDVNTNGKWGSLKNRNKAPIQNNTLEPSEEIAGPSKPTRMSSHTSGYPAENHPGTSREGQLDLPVKLVISPDTAYNPSVSNGMFAFKNKLNPSAAHSERLRRLDLVTQRLRQYEESFQREQLREQKNFANKEDDKESIPSPKKHRRNQLSIYVLDISRVKSDECVATWLNNENCTVASDAPEETILYSFVAGKGELIMFGGIKRDANCLNNYSNTTEQVSNTLHFIKAPKSVI